MRSKTHRRTTTGKRPRKRNPLRWLGRALALAFVLLLAYHASIVARIVYFKFAQPGETAFMDERDHPSPRSTWVPLEQISPQLVRAVIAGEDFGFMQHGGIDWAATREAAQANREAERVVRGGSTITQQLAKNLFLSPRRSYVRKAHEALIALELEAILGKRRIMELYLNVIEWGDGIYGAEAAARHYFDKPAARLNGYQAAYLAAMIPGPREAHNPKINPRRHAVARKRISRAMQLVKLPRALADRSETSAGG